MSKKSGKEKKALSGLTEDFLNQLKSVEGKEVDLSKLEKSLGVSKRRLYDVTNVLTGINLVERSGKAKVKWIGQTSEESDLKQCAEQEKELDEMLAFVDTELDSILASQDFQDYGWLSTNDILSLAPDSKVTIYSLKGPNDLTITNAETNHLVCTSETGGIEFSPVNPS